jgi:hypothetical protein
MHARCVGTIFLGSPGSLKQATFLPSPAYTHYTRIITIHATYAVEG